MPGNIATVFGDPIDVSQSSCSILRGVKCLLVLSVMNGLDYLLIHETCGSFGTMESE